MCMLPNSEEMHVLCTKTHHLSPLLYGRNLMTISLGPFPRLSSAFLAIWLICYLYHLTTQMGAAEKD